MAFRYYSSFFIKEICLFKKNIKKTIHDFRTCWDSTSGLKPKFESGGDQKLDKCEGESVGFGARTIWMEDI